MNISGARQALNRAAVAGPPAVPDIVYAPISYTVPTGEKPYVHNSALTGAAPRYFATMEDRQVAIRNARPFARDLSLDREGVELLWRPSRVQDFYDDAEVERVYYPEVLSLMREVAGAARVVIFDHTRRTDRCPAEGQVVNRSTDRGPASRAHNDYTERSGRQRIYDLLGPQEAARYQGKRVAQVNAWRPIRGPVERTPLAFLDATSVAPGDLIATDNVYPDRVGEIYHVAYNPDHHWLYFPKMRRDEVALIKGYDSLKDGRARFTPHTAFTDPTTREGAPPRESIEVRTLLLFDY